MKWQSQVEPHREKQCAVRGRETRESRGEGKLQAQNGEWLPFRETPGTLSCVMCGWLQSSCPSDWTERMLAPLDQIRHTTQRLILFYSWAVAGLWLQHGHSWIGKPSTLVRQHRVKRYGRKLNRIKFESLFSYFLQNHQHTSTNIFKDSSQLATAPVFHLSFLFNSFMRWTKPLINMSSKADVMSLLI